MAASCRSPWAEADLDAILNDFVQKNPAVADRNVSAFTEKSHLLSG
jgi:hypothetical protein